MVATHTAAFWIMTQHILVDGYRPFEGSCPIFGAERNEGTMLSRFVDNYLQTIGRHKPEEQNTKYSLFTLS